MPPEECTVSPLVNSLVKCRSIGMLMWCFAPLNVSISRLGKMSLRAVKWVARFGVVSDFSSYRTASTRLLAQP